MLRQICRASAFALIVLSGFSGCSYVNEFNEKRYSRHNDRGEAWLSDQIEPAGLNVGGTWKSDDWGNGFLYQNGRTVSGQLGNYSVKGVVSGPRLYLLFRDGDWTYYSAVLDGPNPFVLEGRYTRSLPFVKAGSSSIRLDRVGPPLP